jgi:hypothetical protein
VLKKKIWANLQTIIELFPKNCQKALKNMVLGSGIRKNLFRIPDPGVKKAPDPGSGSATLAVPFRIFSTWIVGCGEQNKKVDKTVQQGFEVGGARLALR